MHEAIQLSPDPLLDKYPYISPYAYCAWNPVKYIDPDGMYFDETGYLVILPFGLPEELVMKTPNCAVPTLKKL